jgi:hypothetical protein
MFVGSVVGLLIIVSMTLSIGPQDRLYVKAHHSVYLVCLCGLLYVAAVKPPSMWGALIRATRTLRAGSPPERTDALAVMLLALLVLSTTVALTVVDWNAVGRSRGLSAVVAVNLAVILRGLWHRYTARGGDGAIRRKPLRRNDNR